MLANGKQGETPTGGADMARIGPFAIARLNLRDAVSLVRTSVQQREQLDIAICNAHTVLTALDNPDYANTLQKMTLLNDGIGINLASRLLDGRPFPANLNGTDLVPNILAGVGIPMRIYLLGAREEQVRGAKQHIEARYPDHQVVGCRDGFFREEDVAGLCAEINATRPDLLLVAMGNPRQEFFIARNRAQLNVPVAVGVGALFDFMSGAVVRAPAFVRKAGLEWLFRLLQEPRRLFHRYVIGIPRFLFAVARFKYGRSEKSA
ncbi:WecB/TagA/CpsF family glycosyltransferase [Roseibium sp.]|uniref:WecB/TagA/CpsF family glycosyltransferase n=1 Tax=Roseibium sp. TaxID=1936156 RepID=UPI003BB0F30C